jgi:hypothetical protein
VLLRLLRGSLRSLRLSDLLLVPQVLQVLVELVDVVPDARRVVLDLVQVPVRLSSRFP